jgi:hypothetical protein
MAAAAALVIIDATLSSKEPLVLYPCKTLQLQGLGFSGRRLTSSSSRNESKAPFCFRLKFCRFWFQNLEILNLCANLTTFDQFFYNKRIWGRGSPGND